MPFGSLTGHNVVAGNMCAPASTVTRPASGRQARGGDLDDALRGEAGAGHVEPSLLIVDELADATGDSSLTPAAHSRSARRIP